MVKWGDGHESVPSHLIDSCSDLTSALRLSIVPQRCRTHGGNGCSERINPLSQLRVLGSEGYPDPSAGVDSKSLSRCTLATIDAAETTG